MKPETAVKQLIEICEEKRILMEAILTLTVEQKEVLGQGEDVDRLKRLIETKQEHCNQVDQLDQIFLTNFEWLKSQLGVASLEELQDEPVPGLKLLKVKVKEILEVTRSIQLIDQQNTEKAKERMAAIRRELETVKIGKQVNKGYGKKYTENTSILFDQKR